MANSKKLILFVVEGRSDRAYLYPIKKMVKSCSNNKVEFKITKGDILVQSETNYSNIETKVKETVQEYLKLAEKMKIQLIITTKATKLMDLKLLRRDEIWFISRTRTKNYSIYSLDEFDDRFDKNLEAAYLDGRYDVN